MTFQETIKAMPEHERLTFFRAMLDLSEAGRKAGVLPNELGKLYAGVVNEVSANTQAPMLRVHKETARVLKMAINKLEENT